jgi:hypothetical protein
MGLTTELAGGYSWVSLLSGYKRFAMKKFQIFALAALCGMVLNATAQSGIQGFGTVVRVVGIASYSLGDNNWYPLQAGKHLPVGSVVRTGHDGIVDVVLGKEVDMPQATWQPTRISFAPDAPVRGLINYKPSAQQNVIRVTPNTTIAIDKLTITDTGADTVSDTELNLKEGKIYASVKKLSGASQYLVKIPNGIAGVRGTLFSISADGSVSCFESGGGGVVVSLVMPDGTTKTFQVSPGTMMSGGGLVIPITPETMDSLRALFVAIRTMYDQVVDFSYDQTRCYVSPTQGGRGKHKGNGNGNGNGGGEPD